MTRDPRLVGVDLDGRVLLDADAYGKHLFVRFDDGRSLHAHLMMTGSFAVGRPSREPAWKRRIELATSRGPLTGEAVPQLAMVPTVEEGAVTRHLGPDLCALAGPADAGVIVARMLRSPEAPLAGALLDQRNAAGFGNVYANDLPFVFGIHPAQAVGTIERLDAVLTLGVAMIRVNAASGVQNTTGRRLPRAGGWVHGAGARPCPVCGTRLIREPEAAVPWGRATTHCPACQPLRPRRPADVARARHLTALHPAARSLPAVR